MNRFTLAAILGFGGALLAAAPEARAQNAASWTGLGGSELEGGVSGSGVVSPLGGEPSIAVDAAGNPVVAWGETTATGQEVHVRRWNPVLEDWEELDGSATGNGISGAIAALSGWPRVQVDAAGDPVVAWIGGMLIFANNVYLKKWDSGLEQWVELDGSGAGVGVSGTSDVGLGAVSMALDASGAPIVAWGVGTLPSQIRVKAWKGGAWTELDGSAGPSGISASPAGSFNPSLAVDSKGRPWVAWMEGPGFLQGEIFLKRWDGEAWSELGGSASGGGVSATEGWAMRPALALDARDVPTLSWLQWAANEGKTALYLKQWNGASWQELGGSATGPGASGSAGAVVAAALGILPSGAPLVLFQDNDSSGKQSIIARTLEGQAWQSYPDPAGSGSVVAGPAGAPGMPALALDPRKTSLAVAWLHNDEAGLYDALALTQSLEFSLSSLSQARDEEPVGLGETIPPGPLQLTGTFASLAQGSEATLEIELQPVGAPFTGVPTQVSLPAGAGGIPEVGVDPGPGQWRWRARARDDAGTLTAWKDFGFNAAGEADFIVAVGSAGGGGGGGSGSSCGSAVAGGAWILLLLPILGRPRIRG